MVLPTFWYIVLNIVTLVVNATMELKGVHFIVEHVIVKVVMF